MLAITASSIRCSCVAASSISIYLYHRARGGKHRAAMNILDAAVRKLVAALAAFGGLVILSQMPSSEFAEAVRCDKLVLGVARRPVVGPIAWLIKHATPVLDHLLRVVIGALVQFHGHDAVAACFERTARCGSRDCRIGDAWAWPIGRALSATALPGSSGSHRSGCRSWPARRRSRPPSWYRGRSAELGQAA